MTTAPPPPREEDDEPPSLPDAVWEEFTKDTAGRIRASAPKEPSARARMVTERFRREDAERAERARRSKPRWRGGKGRRPQEPEGWRTGPAWQDMQRGRRGPWRDRIRTLLIVAAVAALALVAINPSGARSLVLGHGNSSGSHEDSSDSTPLTPETAQPTAAPDAAADPDIPTTSHPFAGSPALNWAAGADAIVLPHAEKVGDVTARQVDAALRATKAYLVGTNLDPAELRGGYPDAALHVVDPINGGPAQVKAALSSPSAKTDPTVWLTRYDPHEVRLVGDVIKVRGRMTFTKSDHESVRVHTDYTYVYAFTKAGNGDGTVQRLIARRVVDTQWYPRGAPGKVQLVRIDAYFGGSGCEHDGYLHPSPSENSGVNPSGPVTDPYDRSKPLDKPGTCGVASRT